MKLVLAPGVSFDPAAHEYFYRDRRLSGVTALIAKRRGAAMESSFLEEHRVEGIHIHEAVQRWIDTGEPNRIHPGVQWVTETLEPLRLFYDKNQNMSTVFQLK